MCAYIDAHTDARTDAHTDAHTDVHTDARTDARTRIHTHSFVLSGYKINKQVNVEFCNIGGCNYPPMLQKD